ncbi:transposase [Alphaproteobacteria bacterium]|nr:transposase [Alphaproteobacteria bacterium]GHS95802.1 transposase [Alphaproteobacteria bacterium]
MDETLLKPSTDFVFKRVFGAESHKRVLVCLLNAILKGKPQIASIELENTEIPRDTSDGKDVRLDIRARTPEGTILSIEIQCVNKGDLIHRSAFYQARMMPAELKAGRDYNEIPNMISIWIADYTATKRKHHTNEIVYMYKSNEKDKIEIATEKFRTFIIELSKIEYKNIHHADMFSVWMMFIKHPETIPQEFLSIPEVHEAMDELTKLSYNKIVRAQYEARQKLINDEHAAFAFARKEGLKEGIAEGLEKGIAEGLEKGIAEGLEKGIAEGLEKGIAEGLEKGLAEGLEKGIAEGLEKGIAEGLEKGKEEGIKEGIKEGTEKIALSMLSKNFPIDTIATCTGLSEEEILKLRQS